MFKAKKKAQERKENEEALKAAEEAQTSEESGEGSSAGQVGSAFTLAKNKPKKKKASTAKIRFASDLDELQHEKYKSWKLEFPDPSNILNLHIVLTPVDGPYVGGTFEFTCSIPEDYPHAVPKVKCTTKVYHPNIDLDGNICLNILREDWSPVMSLKSIIHGLEFLFIQPNPDDPLHKEAADMMVNNPAQFQRLVRNYINGRYSYY